MPKFGTRKIVIANSVGSVFYDGQAISSQIDLQGEHDEILLMIIALLFKAHTHCLNFGIKKGPSF